MSVRVRAAPSPTGYLHIGNVHTFLFNWLFARHEGGEFRLRIENTDTGREVAEAVEQIQESLRWLGLEWDGPVTFQLDRIDLCQDIAQRLLSEGKAYEDEGAVRFRMPDDGTTSYDDVVFGPIEVANETIEDVVILRSDGRPTYNFASPVEDLEDAITHVIRGTDHVSYTPKQIRILEALGAQPPTYAHLPFVNGPDGRKLSKRHGAVTVDEFRSQGYLPDALVNFLALLGWSYDDRTEVMSRQELVERFSLERVGKSPAVFDYVKLADMNGKYLRALPAGDYADVLVSFLRERGYTWDESLVRRTAPLVQEKIATLGEYPSFAGFFFDGTDGVEAASLDPELLRAARDALVDVEPFEAGPIEEALRDVATQANLKPRQAFQPIRLAITGASISPGLFESLEVLGKEESLARLQAVLPGPATGSGA